MILHHFQERGYPLELLQHALDKVMPLDRMLLLKATHETENEDDIVALVTTFVPQFSDLSTIVKRNWALLERSSTTKKMVGNKLIVSYRRPKNLKDILVRARLPKLRENNNDKTMKTTEKNACKNKTGSCRYCTNLNKSGRIKSYFSQREYQCKTNVTCKLSNLIYCIQCRTCHKQYVGQTKNTLMQRFQGHWTDIKSRNPKTDVGRHFTQRDFKGGDDMELFVVDFIHAHPTTEFALSLRNEIEFHWIQRLRTMVPHGINTMDHMPDPHEKSRDWKSFHKSH